MGKKRVPGGNRTIRGQLVRVVLIPSVSFLLLWAIISSTGTIQASEFLLSMREGSDSIAATRGLAAELREERRLSQIRLGDPTRDGARTTLAEQRESTDAALDTVLDHVAVLESDEDGEVRRNAQNLQDAPDDLETLRGKVGTEGISRDEALTEYTSLVERTQLLTESLLRILDDGEGLSASVLSRDLITAREQFSRAEALLVGAIAAGKMNYQETAHFTYLTASYRDTLTASESAMSGELRQQYTRMRNSGAWQEAERLSRTVVTRPPVTQPDVPGDPAEWNSEINVGHAEWSEATQSAGAAFGDLVTTQVERAIDIGWDAAVRRITLSAVGCLLTLVAGSVAIVVAMRSAGRITDRLRRLRGETLSLSGTRLPGIVARAQGGKRVDITEELPHLSYGDDEIGQVADAFNTAQRTALGAAVKQAEIRKGANRVFLGIAYRNQTLVQRQLRTLEEIDHNETDPAVLERLLHLEHLVTRSRRYADNLIILGGSQSTQRWRRPLELGEVLRAAVAETEDCERVQLVSAHRAWLRGTAVADIVHLIAELVENATQFSPQDAPVSINCGPVLGGIAVDVEDRGLGMTEQGYAAAQRTLDEAPEFDVMALPDEPRLGLFVVARLAARHDTAVRLCPSPYGGTRATVIIPDELLEPEFEERALSSAPENSRLSATR
ncbi:signal transduction histidine kinase [Haloactinospora alba]|uniref:histidine kinase n=1 Tax=Haloactinospora alba TaxID=405555 RepID=A0A543NHH1_9ACTN|nr:nitrate- and nitrite sensing domain-containing protein [Haloactinospora alba]TQN31292.1 signal transduction histidine kinase [Haloactinospora alba]